MSTKHKELDNSDSENEVEVSKRNTKKKINKPSDDDDDFDPPLITKRGGTTTLRQRRFEAVFFAKYLEFDRPSEEDIKEFFSSYGTVDHIGYPEGRNFVKVYMTELSTKRETRRTFHTICQMYQDMKPSERFLIQIAKKKQQPPPPSSNFRGRRPMNNRRGGRYDYRDNRDNRDNRGNRNPGYRRH